MEESARIEAADGPRLEARLGLVPGARGGLLLCHPHPLYGGDMDNPVVVRAAEVAREATLCTLRFNFRGVGASTGTHGAGEGELEDIRAGLETLESRLPPGRPLGLLGYSFGAWVAARVVEAGTRVAALGLIAPPLGAFEWPALDGGETDVLLVAGTRDPYCPAQELEGLAARLAGAERVLVEGADHFFFGKLFPLGEAVGRWARRWAAG